MATRKAKILIVDDHPMVRETISDLIEKRFQYEVCSPESFKKLKEALTFEVFDSVLVDVDLARWDVPDNIDGKRIEDGTDVADFYSDLHETTAGSLYSTHVRPSDSGFATRFDRKIRNLRQKIKDSSFEFIELPKALSLNMEEIEGRFKPFLEAAEEVYKSNPLLKPPSYYDKYARYLRAYKKVCRLHANFLSYNFQSVGDCAWGVICGRGPVRRLYGTPLDGDPGRLREFEIEPRGAYPSKEELEAVSKERNAFPFVVWNTRKAEFLERQMRLAGPRLADIPDHLQDFFGLAVAPAFVRAYTEGRRGQVIEWCKWLSPTAQFEILKLIYKELYGTPPLEDFLESCRAARLPRVVEVYDARVDDIESEGEGEREESVAWVELREIGGYTAVAMEPFDLRQLQNNGVDHESQRFDYAVFQLPDEKVVMSIEPVEYLD